MEYVMVLCTVFALIYGDINAMVEQGGNENKTLLTEVCEEEEEKAGVDERFANLSDEEKENEWFGSVLSQNLAKFIKYFAVNGFDLNSENEDGKTALIISCERGNAEFVKGLLENGANPNFSADNGALPLEVAVRKNHPEIVKMLMETGDVQSTGYAEVMAEKYLRGAVEAVEDAEHAINSLEIAKKAAEAIGENRDMKDINNSIARNQKILEEKSKEKAAWTEILEMFEKSKAETTESTESTGEPSIIELSI